MGWAEGIEYLVELVEVFDWSSLGLGLPAAGQSSFVQGI